MMPVVNILFTTIGILLGIPAAVFFVENTLTLIAGLFKATSASDGCQADLYRSTQRPKLAVLVPAHNEEQGIAMTVASIRSQLREGDRVVVIADNCSDNTATAASDAGAQVAQREDAQNRGKGFALAHGIDALADDAPVVVVFVDADCLLDPGTLDALIEQVERTGTVAQAVNLSNLPEGESSIRDRISAFAIRVKNESRPIGLSLIGGPCLITGTGFAMPWKMASAELFGRGDIVEDMTIGLELAAAGNPPKICRAGRVHSPLPTSDQAKQTQRERWEHGHIDTLLKQGLPMLLRGIFTLRPQLVLLGLELTVPPLSLLVLLIGSFAVLTGLLSIIGLGVWAVGAAVLAFGLVSLGTFAGWLAVGRDILPAYELPGAAWYAVCKVPIYITAAIKRQRGWVRTARDDE